MGYESIKKIDDFYRINDRHLKKIAHCDTILAQLSSCIFSAMLVTQDSETTIC